MRRKLERAIVSGIENAPVSYWPIFPVPSLQSQKPLWQSTRPNVLSVSKMAKCVALHPGTISKGSKLWPRALSIQQKLRFEISEIPRAHWNGTFRLHRPNSSHRAFFYCSFKQDTKEQYWGQQFCHMKRDISFFFPTEMTGPVTPNWNGTFHLISYRNIRNFRLMESAHSFPLNLKNDHWR